MVEAGSIKNSILIRLIPWQHPSGTERDPPHSRRPRNSLVIPRPALERIAYKMNIPVVVFGLATFYAQFKLQLGRNIIRVCMGTACHIQGAEDDRIQEILR